MKKTLPKNRDGTGFGTAVRKGTYYHLNLVNLSKLLYTKSVQIYLFEVVMKLSQYVDVAKLNEMVAKGWISCRPHPTLPIRIYNYADPVHVLQDRTQEAFEAFWASHEVCACRGLIVDNEDNIIARPQYKFFNLGQKATIMSDGPYYGSLPSVDVNVVVDGFFLAEEAVNRSITITRKMDGMMGILWEYNGQWGISTRGSFESAGADFASEKWQKFVKYGATEFVPKDYTLIFEIIANHLRIVVPYNWEGLCLLTAVNKVTGEEMPYEQLKHERRGGYDWFS